VPYCVAHVYYCSFCTKFLLLLLLLLLKLHFICNLYIYRTLSKLVWGLGAMAWGGALSSALP
jgi:hypothetical protein